ncbi:hypothetical protein BCON_0179g00270 [Botryotinia convoluta]|uniref:Uncharacterized protein n=1 Tax=Botryotinia convoluta TaxID=54673 RepID=A0A4Z1HNH4_9HELO|nr:hypothetical protein BCON_0179g00270 [Botryotinia convoluta]
MTKVIVRTPSTDMQNTDLSEDVSEDVSKLLSVLHPPVPVHMANLGMLPEDINRFRNNPLGTFPHLYC